MKISRVAPEPLRAREPACRLWGERPWEPLSGSIEWSRVRGWLAIILLIAAPVSAQPAEILQNPGFEEGTAGWFGFGSASLSNVSSPVLSGDSAVLVENRTQSWNGVAQSLMGDLQPGITYAISAWVRLVDPGNQPVLLTIQKTDSAGTSFANIDTTSASGTQWVQLSGSYTLSAVGDLTALTLYMEGPAAGVSFYADDFSVTAHDWKAAANERIESIRKRDVLLKVVDASGQPVPGAQVTVNQTRHRFAFGSAINGNISNPSYAAFFKTNFQWAVMENESKWYANEPSQGNVTYSAANAITNFCFANNITLRGHTIFWAVDRFVQPWVTNLSDANLRVALTNRLKSVVNHFKGTFRHWDVNNEMLHGNFFGNRLGNWVNPWMFQYAHSLDPNALLFVNDYNVVSANETAAYKQQIQNLLSSNAPVHGIGAQGHFGAVIDPGLTEARLDSLAELGLPIWISEYDSVNADENVRADNLEKLYRIAFSKEAVDGILMWGFWAGSHWRGADAAIVNLNWSLNEAGRRYQSLLEEWTTRTNGTTGASGDLGFRGFHGEYDILVATGTQTALRRITLEPGAGTSVHTLIVNPESSRPILHGPLHVLADGRFAFQLSGDAGRSNQLQASLDLVNWDVVGTVFNPTGTVSFTNSGPAQESLFYRARVLP